MQRTRQVRLFSDTLAAFTFWGWQAVAVILLVSLPLGNTTTKEYAEIEFTGAIRLAIVWSPTQSCSSAPDQAQGQAHLCRQLVLRLVHPDHRDAAHRQPHVAAGELVQVLLDVPGATDAMVQWWYGQQRRGFFLTTGFLGMMYLLRAQAGRRSIPYRLSIVHFWALITLYIWAGPHHLHYTALPDWAQSLGMVMSLILLAPSWGGMINGMMTLRARHKLRDDPILRFLGGVPGVPTACPPSKAR